MTKFYLFKKKLNIKFDSTVQNKFNAFNEINKIIPPLLFRFFTDIQTAARAAGFIEPAGARPIKDIYVSQFACYTYL